MSDTFLDDLAHTPHPHPEPQRHDEPSPSSESWSDFSVFDDMMNNGVEPAPHRRHMSKKKLARERHQREVALVAARWDTPRLAVVLNEKGAAGKTPLSVLLSGAFGTYGGRTPVCVDIDPVAKLGNRLEVRSRHTMDDMLPRLDTLVSGLNPSEIYSFTAHQPSGHFDALIGRSRRTTQNSVGETVLAEPTITVTQTTQILDALSRVYTVLIADAGNNIADDPAKTALKLADVLVLPIRWLKEFLKPALQMLQDLDSTGHGDLTRQVVFVHMTAKQSDPFEESHATEYTERLLARNMIAGNRVSVLNIPYDPHIAQGEAIIWDKLQPATREAALHVAAEIATRFNESVWIAQHD